MQGGKSSQTFIMRVSDNFYKFCSFDSSELYMYPPYKEFKDSGVYDQLKGLGIYLPVGNVSAHFKVNFPFLFLKKDG